MNWITLKKDFIVIKIIIILIIKYVWIGRHKILTFAENIYLMASINDLEKQLREEIERKGCNYSSFTMSRYAVSNLCNGKGFVSSLCSVLDDMDLTVVFVPKKALKQKKETFYHSDS